VNEGGRRLRRVVADGEARLSECEKRFGWRCG
jgi:hypothetical protein